MMSFNTSITMEFTGDNIDITNIRIGLAFQPAAASIDTECVGCDPDLRLQTCSSIRDALAPAAIEASQPFIRSARISQF
jgi:hypothetical protein